MHPPDVDLLFLLHPAQSESVQATTFSDSSWYLYQFTTLGYRARYLTSLTSLFQSSLVGAVILLVASFVANAMSTVSCAKKVALAAILQFFCRIVFVQCVAIVIIVGLASHLTISACVHSHLVSSLPLFLVPPLSRLAPIWS